MNTHSAFLSPGAIAHFKELGSSVGGWEQGRQKRPDGHEIGYEKLDLVRAQTVWRLYDGTADKFVDTYIRKALDLVRPSGWWLWDAYLLRYVNTGELPLHVDPAPEGFRHMRLNAVVEQSEAGGVFKYVYDGEVLSVRPVEGDAVVFSPQVMHGVSRVIGRRVVFSVGALVAL